MAATAKQFTLDILTKAIRGSAAAFRCRTQLQPAGGPGDKVFPPTYEGGVYATETRRVPGKDTPIRCVLMDSVQSQANRMEEALQQAIDDGRLTLPLVVVDFAGKGLLAEVGRITSLQAPHRIADAILRDSLIEGKAFRQSSYGKTLDVVSLANATPLYDLCPTALVFGMWDSTGPKGGLGAKFARALVSEIVGIDAQFGVKTSSRIDPLQIGANAGPLYLATGDGPRWTNDEKDAVREKGKPVLYSQGSEAGKPGNPSKANHGNVTPSLSKRDRNDEPLTGGVTVAAIEQCVVLSLPALRRLRFPIKNSPSSAEVNYAGQTVLAALGLCAAALAAERGFDLRSRCLLWPSEPMAWEILERPGAEPSRYTIEATTAIEVLQAAVAAAKKAGLAWREDPLLLEPSPQLIALVQRSQELAASGVPLDQGNQ